MSRIGDPASSPTSAEDAGLDDFRHLVRMAFQQARDRGRPDWEEMTAAVLKNRLLGLTGKQFSEVQYGALTFVPLIRKIPDLVEVVDDRPPVLLRLRSATLDRTPSSPVPTLSPVPARLAGERGSRIRSDLWQAMIDYTSGERYVFDPGSGLARQRRSDDDDLPEIPTLTSEDLARWREMFQSTLEDDRTVRWAALDEWVRGPGRISELPKDVRGKWVEFLKRHVFERLDTWFRQRELPTPLDLLVASGKSGRSGEEHVVDTAKARRLRDVLVQLVRSMTYEELLSIHLPAAVLLRLAEPKSVGDD